VDSQRWDVLSGRLLLASRISTIRYSESARTEQILQRKPKLSIAMDSTSAAVRPPARIIIKSNSERPSCVCGRVILNILFGCVFRLSDDSAKELVQELNPT